MFLTFLASKISKHSSKFADFNISFPIFGADKGVLNLLFETRWTFQSYLFPIFIDLKLEIRNENM